MKDCFTPHAYMHSLMGLGIGLFLASVIPGLAVWWLGLVIIIVAIAWDSMRKN